MIENEERDAMKYDPYKEMGGYMKPLVSLDSSCHGRRCPPLDSSRQGSSAAFGNHCQGNAVPFGNLCQQDAPRPYWMTQGQRSCRPFGIPARFEMSIHKEKMVCGHSFQNDKTQNPQSFIRKGNEVQGIVCVTSEMEYMLY